MSYFVPTRFVWRFGGRQVSTRPRRSRALRGRDASCDAGTDGDPVVLSRMQVHLCGSFTRWVETVPMAPVDGSPGLFAVVVHLPPG